jgi:hypothetical protein
MSRDQNAGRSQIIKTDNSSFERVEKLRYLQEPLTHQNSIQEEIKSTLMSGNACCNSVHEKGGACSTHGGEVHTGSWWGNLKERDYLKDSGVDGRIILR